MKLNLNVTVEREAVGVSKHVAGARLTPDWAELCLSGAVQELHLFCIRKLTFFTVCNKMMQPFHHSVVDPHYSSLWCGGGGGGGAASGLVTPADSVT